MTSVAHAPRFSALRAVVLAREFFGLEARAEDLPSERDRNFLLTTASATSATTRLSLTTESTRSSMTTESSGAPGFAQGSISAVLASGNKSRASGEPKARPLTK